MSGPAAAGPFPADVLDANRAGRLTDDQRTSWTGTDRQWGGNVALIALVLAGAGVALLIGLGHTPLPTPLRLLGGGQLTRDLRDGRVEAVEGAISKEHDVLPTYAGANPERCYIDVAGTRLACGRIAYDAAPDAGTVRVYYLPRSHRLINLERLADRPLPAGALDSPDVMMAQAVRAIGAHDGAQRAEAMATVAAIKDAMTGPATPPPAGQQDARPLAEAIVGSWDSPVMNLMFAPDGTASASLATGMRLAGRWSVGGDGQLRLDGMGEDMATDAWIAGDVLTVVMNSDHMAFRRTASA